MKCNVDAAIFNAEGKYSVGCVIHNSRGEFAQGKYSVGCVIHNYRGEFVTIQCECFSSNFGSQGAKALGIREALPGSRGCSCLVLLSKWTIFKFYKL